MRSALHRRVAHPPPRPLLLFDGDCHFCRRWIERWHEITADRIDYAPFQEAGARFPEIPPEEFERAVQLIETNGEVLRAAEAVYRSLSYGRGRRWLRWSYERLPGFAPISEFFYRQIARRRALASAGTRLLWGNDVRRPTYFVARNIFLRALGLIYLIAFVSLWLQVDGLIGAKGISPVAEFLPAAREAIGSQAPVLLPTLCWFNSSDAFLHFLCGGGALVSVLLIAGLAPVISLAFLFVCYLSLTIAGQTFLSFQWDILLLEAGFLALFFAPWIPRLTRKINPPLSRVGLLLLKLLLFKLMLMSGVVKLTSGDDSWWNLTALDYHYWTQPLPTTPGWWAQQGPEWLKHFSTAFVLGVECVAPFFIWAPRRLRHVACAFFIALQILIALTGNYCFFNLLTIALCLLLVDDAHAGTHLRLPALAGSVRNSLSVRGIQDWPAIAILVVTLPLNAMLIFSAFKPQAEWPRPIVALYGVVEPFRVVNGYGLFRVMTKSRSEIILEGSADGIDWLPYEFKWKPGDVKRAPGWVAPHQPRLDWQMWFAALGTYRNNPWFVHLIERLLRNGPEVVQLLGHNPFPDRPPRYIRSKTYDYQFTTRAERRETGAWWKREERGEYLPTVSLDDFTR